MLLFFYVGSLTAMENLSARNRLMIGLSVKFSECHEETTLKSSSTITKRGQLFDVNRRAVYHSLETGGGYEGLRTFCALMNIPFIAEPAYYKQIDAILAALEAKADEETKKAENRIGEHVFKETNQVGSDEIVDAAIAFDSTWAKKWFTSLI